MSTDNIIGATVGVMTLKVAGDLMTKGKKSSKKTGKIKFNKIKW